MKKVYIVSAKRTPLGSFGGSLAGFSAPELGVIASKSAIQAAQIDPNLIEEVYYGNVCSANLGQAPARQVALGSGLSTSTPSTTINKVCASGMKAVMLGAQSIQTGQNTIVMAGGMESMSNIPFYLPKLRWGAKYGHSEIIDGLQKDGLTDAYDHLAMGTCGDTTAEKYNISREQQDEFAIGSYKKAAQATENKAFKDEIAEVTIPQKGKDPIIMTEDEEYKNVRFEKIPQLRPAFTKDGTITAANASTINDGAATLILVDENSLTKYNLTPLAEIVSFADAAQEPQWFTTAPVKAANLALERAGLNVSDIDYFEVNEAFAVVALAFAQEMSINLERMNAHGGAVALGHPLGASGARILVTLLHVLKKQNAKTGLAAICNGGGGASAIIVKMV
jgi:acetyl-CoA C-acetyltransferase